MFSAITVTPQHKVNTLNLDGYRKPLYCFVYLCFKGTGPERYFTLMFKSVWGAFLPVEEGVGQVDHGEFVQSIFWRFLLETMMSFMKE